MPSVLSYHECAIHGNAKHRTRRSGQLKCLRCEVDYLDAYRKERRKQLVDLCGGKCSRCGYNKTTNALDFHHVVPKEKEFNLALTGMTRPWKRILEEAAKCVLVCRNCHAEIHEELTLDMASVIE